MRNLCLATAAAAALLLAACSRPAPQASAPEAAPGAAPGSAPERACTMIGCDDGLNVLVEGTPQGAYRVEVRAEGHETQVVECPAPTECGRIFLAGFLPEEVTVELTAGEARSSRTVKPEIETVQPNGPDCPPTCRQATIRVPWPDGPTGDR